MRTSLWHELVVPAPGRLERTLQLVAVTSIVVVISMANGLPEPGLSAYIVFFVSKEDAGRTLVTAVVFIIAILVVIGTVLALLPYTLDSPSLRILVIAGASFALFFLGSASKLAPLAGTLGLVLASALNSEQSLPTGEIAVRAVLYILLVCVFPIVAQIAFTVCAGRWPDRLLRRGLATRLRLAAQALRGGDPAALDAAIAAGDGEFLAQLKMAGLLHACSREALARLSVVVPASFGVLLAVRTWRDRLAAGETAALADRLDALARRVASFPRRRGTPGGDGDEAHPIATLVSAMENALSQASLPAPAAAAKAGKSAKAAGKKEGFFKPDAFSNPAHERFAAKATAAAMVCYITFNILDYTKISTCLVTVFIVALSTTGESTQKMALRITGCTLGAAVGYAAIVFALPHATGIAGLLMLMTCITVPAGWISFGSPRIGYIGFQMAFAAYLCVLQGLEPKFDLEIARDRFIGILFGNVVVYLVFASFYPTSLLPGLGRRLTAILGRCGAVVCASCEATPVLALAGEVAAVQGLVAQIDQAVIAYGFEERADPAARLHTLSCRLIQRALHRLVADVAALATLPSAERRAVDGAAVASRLAALADAIETHGVIERPSRAVSGATGGVIDAFHADLDRLAITALRHRRLAEADGGGSRG